MRRLIAEEQTNKITCLEDIKSIINADTLQKTICDVMENIFLGINNREIVARYLDANADAFINNKKLEELDYGDIRELIEDEGHQTIGEQALKALNLELADDVDVRDIGEEIFLEWDGYPYSVINHLMHQARLQKWDMVREEYEEYFDEGNSVTSIYELNDLDDEVGEVVELDGEIDFDSRDNPFLYLDGEIIWGDFRKTHTQTLQEYNEEQGIEEALSSDYHRLQAEEIQDTNDVEEVGFGHYGNDVAVIDNDFESCDEDDIADALLEQVDKVVNKIYFRQSSDELLRVAKKHLLS